MWKSVIWNKFWKYGPTGIYKNRDDLLSRVKFLTIIHFVINSTHFLKTWKEPTRYRMCVPNMSRSGQCSVCVIRQTYVYRTEENSYASCRLMHIAVTSAFPWSQWLKTVKGKRSPIFRNRLVCHIANSWRYMSAS